ncbi:hypothetical protein U1Q18_014142 [Sarracenia purpurea var. burkii]
MEEEQGNAENDSPRNLGRFSVEVGNIGRLSESDLNVLDEMPNTIPRNKQGEVNLPSPMTSGEGISVPLAASDLPVAEPYVFMHILSSSIIWVFWSTVFFESWL